MPKVSLCSNRYCFYYKREIGCTPTLYHCNAPTRSLIRFSVVFLIELHQTAAVTPHYGYLMLTVLPQTAPCPCIPARPHCSRWLPTPWRKSALTCTRTMSTLFGSFIVLCTWGVIILHFIGALCSFSTLPDLMRMAVRQGKHGAHLSTQLKAASRDWGLGWEGVEREWVCPPEEYAVNRHKRLLAI